MRVFYAVEFDEDVKDYVYDILTNVKEKSVKGNFSRKDNIHLTLKFIGEVEDYEITDFSVALKQSMKNKPSFFVTMNHIGTFKKGNKSIVWIGIEKNSELNSLHEVLEEGLFRLGYGKDTRSYTPHITIGRQVVLKNEKDDLNISVNKRVQIKKISLMKSARENGVLTYTPISSISLM